ncbi:unnamed protein product [Arctogadus glacialis]
MPPAMSSRRGARTPRGPGPAGAAAGALTHSPERPEYEPLLPQYEPLLPQYEPLLPQYEPLLRTPPRATPTSSDDKPGRWKEEERRGGGGGGAEKRDGRGRHDDPEPRGGGDRGRGPPDGARSDSRGRGWDPPRDPSPPPPPAPATRPAPRRTRRRASRRGRARRRAGAARTKRRRNADPPAAATAAQAPPPVTEAPPPAGLLPAPLQHSPRKGAKKKTERKAKRPLGGGAESDGSAEDDAHLPPGKRRRGPRTPPGPSLRPGPRPPRWTPTSATEEQPDVLGSEQAPRPRAIPPSPSSLSLLRRFIKRDALAVTPYKLVRLDVTDQKVWLSPKEVDIGMGATAAINVM